MTARAFLVALACALLLVATPARAAVARVPAQDPFEEARALRRAGDVHGAIARLEELRRGRPDDAELAGLLGLCLLDAGDLPAASALAGTPPPGADAAFRWLVFTGRLALASGRPEDAIAPLEAALAASPRPVEALVALVEAHAAKERYARAVELAEQLEAYVPELGRAMRADLLVAQGDRMAQAGAEAIPLAIERYDEALALRPDDAAIQRKLLDVLVYAHRAEEAWPLVETLFPLASEPVEHHVQAARVARAATDEVRARGHLEQALALDPAHVEARLELARLLLDGDEPQAACDALAPVLDTQPDLARAHLLLGTAEEARGRWEPAERALRRAVELEPDNAKALYHLGRVLVRLGRADEGKAMLERFRALDT